MKEIVWLEQCTSTNDEAVKYLDNPSIAAVVSKSQTAGRGRLGREWISQPDVGLYLSWIARPQFESALGSAIPLLAAVATGEVCRQLHVHVQLKWPNDVLVEGKKVAGILCEARGTPQTWSAIVGIGLNLKRPADGWPDHLPAVALDEVTDNHFSRENLARTLVERLTYWVNQVNESGLKPVLSAWMEHGTPIGTPLMRDGKKGTFAGLDSDGALRLKMAHGVELVYAGDVSLASNIEDT